MTLEEKLHKELDWLEIKHIDADGIIRNILTICQQEIDEAKHQGQVELLRRIIQDMFNASALNIPMDYIYHLKKEIDPSPKESE